MQEDRMDIAAKLQNGVSMERILNDIRDNVNQKIGRDHLINRQDLRNIKMEFNVDGITRHKNDITSVAAWVAEMMGLEYNPILLFKNQGQDQPPEMDNTSNDDFVLCIQTEFQRDILQKFGSNIVCIDSTHGTNAYDFKLTTIIVVDEYGEGVPVGWMISNREDALILIEFFKTIRERVGDIHPHWFMTDDAEQYFNAWRAVFGGETSKKLLCAWHVDKAWRKALREHILDKEEQIEVYHQLRLLLTEILESKFRVLLQEFITYVHTHHINFYNYFTNYYCNRLEQWASCYRTHATVNTNMFLESSHRVLKVVHLNNKQNRRIDVLLTTLIRIARDKVFDRLQKTQIGKNTHRICEISKRHRSAENMAKKDSQLIDIVEPGNKWSVKSESQPGVTYIVKKDSSCCCKLLCRQCGVCPHNYKCTCLDSILHATVCKHIHLVVMEMGMISEQQPSLQKVDTIDYFSDLLTPSKLQTDLLALKDTLNSAICTIQVNTSQCTDLYTLNTVLPHLRAAISMFAITEKEHVTTLPVKRKYAANSNHEKQKFFSTKKPRVSLQQTLSKPSQKELQQQELNLSKHETRFCGVCFHEDDKENNHPVNWIECTRCGLWIHWTCTKSYAEERQNLHDDYTCHFCLQND